MTYRDYIIMDLKEPLNQTVLFCDGVFEALRYVDRTFGVVSFEGTSDHVIAICEKTKVSIDIFIQGSL